MRERGLDAADAIVLVPLAEMLPLARAAFAGAGSWPPRVDTAATLAASLGPPLQRAAGALSGDRLADRLDAGALLRGQAWGAAWARRDARGFEHAAATLADTAHALARAAAAQPPSARAAWWARARDALVPLGGPGQTERALARIALEWAAVDDRADTDRVFALQPSAWIVVHAGGGDPWLRSLVATTSTPVLEVDADPTPSAVFEPAAGLPAPRHVVCDGFEDEALAAAGEVLQALAAGQAPVALVALDRALVRRIHALLERTPGLRVHDETGWRLSTTRAAARVMAALRAAAPTASRDDALDWLKADVALPPTTVASLEAAWRGGRAPPPDAEAGWQSQRQRLAALAPAAPQSLRQWLHALAAVLGPAGDDPAAQQVASALRLGDGPGARWSQAAAATRFDLAGFTRWVDAVLDGGVFRPPAPADPQVVITPLSQALLRPFGAVVCPGADDRRLGAAPEPDPLIGDAVAQALGLPTRDVRRVREAFAFAQLLRVAPLVLLRRRRDAGEPLGASPLVERAARARERCGAASRAPQTWQPREAEVARRPLARPAPVLADGWPTRLSASAVQALRDCPYRFFARTVLRLREADELDLELEKRDYGSWLHELLLRFHRERAAPRTPADDLARLLALADGVQDEQALDAAQLLPFRAAFEAFAPRYVQWLRGRDEAGWRWHAGEVERARAPDEALPVCLVGRIDRIDRGAPDPGVETWQLIDYKTGSVEALKKTVRQPLEDTQLAVYAALVQAGAEAPPALQAMYLALDDREAPVEIVHAGIAATALAFVDGLAADWRDLCGGQGLAALGEGPVCERCEMRGLCRRDHWAAPDAGDDGAGR